GARAGHRRAGQPGGLEGGGNVQRGGAARRGVPAHHPARHGEAMKPILTIARRELVSYFTSPVAYVFLVIFLLLTGLFPLTAGYLGSLLLAGAYLAIACMTSAMTRNQVVAFILSVVLCLFLILAGFNAVTDLLTRWASPALVDTVAAFSVVTHFDGFQRGVIDLRDLVFFLSVIGFALFATGVIIRGHRAG